jgi:sideroflexin-5
MLFTSSAGLEHAKQLVTAYKQGQIKDMTPDLWRAKKIIDSTLHPGKGHKIVQEDIWNKPADV